MAHQKKKRHHYIWRSYLRNWAVNDYIQTYFIKSDKWATPNLMNVGQKKYFHRIKKFTTKEYALCKLLFDMLPITSKSSSLMLLDMFSGINNPDVSKIEKNKRKEYQEHIDFTEHNFLEEYFSIIENKGIPYLDMLEGCNTEFLFDLEKRGDFLYFLVVQYSRTKNMRDRLKAVIAGVWKNIEEEIDLDKISILYSLQIADQIATTMALDNKFRFFQLNNKSTTTFITTDQPVINVMANPYKRNEIPKELELFYPLGPHKALIVREDTGDSDFNIDVGEAMVDYYNKELIKHAKEQIYVDNMEHDIIASLKSASNKAVK